MNNTAPLPVTIREATTSDMETLIEYNRGLALETEAKDLDRETLRAGLTALLENPSRGKYLVAEWEGRVVGQLMFTREWSDWRNGEFWWLQSVYVAADARRRGVFQQLYRAVVEQARAQTGVVGIRLYVELENRIAQATYQHLGMRHAGYEVMETTDLKRSTPG